MKSTRFSHPPLSLFFSGYFSITFSCLFLNFSVLQRSGKKWSHFGIFFLPLRYYVNCTSFAFPKIEEKKTIRQKNAPMEYARDENGVFFFFYFSGRRKRAKTKKNNCSMLISVYHWHISVSALFVGSFSTFRSLFWLLSMATESIVSN